MIFIFWIVLALVGAGVNLWRDDEPRSRRRTLEALLLWWLVVCLGVSGLVGGAFHVFDQTSIARQIGFTQGDGGFHFEVGMANWAIGAICVMCFWFRDRFWLAAVVASTIFLVGDGYGHIYQLVVHRNHAPDNSGVVLYSDFIVPAVAVVLYALLERAGGPRPRALAFSARAARGGAARPEGWQSG